MNTDIVIYTAGPSVLDAVNSHLPEAHGDPVVRVAVNQASWVLQSDWVCAGDGYVFDAEYIIPKIGYVTRYTNNESKCPIEAIGEREMREPADYRIVHWSDVDRHSQSYSFVAAMAFVSQHYAAPGARVWVYGCDWTAGPCICESSPHVWTQRRQKAEVAQVMTVVERMRAKGTEVYRARTQPLRWEAFAP